MVFDLVGTTISRAFRIAFDAIHDICAFSLPNVSFSSLFLPFCFDWMWKLCSFYDRVIVEGINLFDISVLSWFYMCFRLRTLIFLLLHYNISNEITFLHIRNKALMIRYGTIIIRLSNKAVSIDTWIWEDFIEVVDILPEKWLLWYEIVKFPENFQLIWSTSNTERFV